MAHLEFAFNSRIAEINEPVAESLHNLHLSITASLHAWSILGKQRKEAK